MKCRFDGKEISHQFVDLGFSPPSNSFLTAEQLNEAEVYYPLKLYVSERSFLVQVDEYKQATEIFSNDYVYFSSFSTSWLAHSKVYVAMMIQRFAYNAQSLVVEIASNDGYLLQYFKENKVPVLGIEPTAGTAKVATEKGIDTLVEFFGVTLAERLVQQGKKADLLLGNNVLAHVPDLNDFVAGLKILLNEGGVITMEFPHLLQLINYNQFDTIYHEHFSYLSLIAAQQIFQFHGLEIFDVEELPTHGGSLRIFAKHKGDSTHEISGNVDELKQKELEAGMNTLEFYRGFQEKINKVKNSFLQFLLEAKSNGKKVAGYGAAAKGNTLLNYAGVKTDLIDFVVDRNPNKQNKFLPGSHIPVFDEGHLRNTKPHFVVIFPWNIQDEVVEQLNYIKEWDAKFVVAIPRLKIF
jgi:2-polyprenyl-3-methyl-5-hydroxy-6-metoxy-1,4-benzoquinol methylase